MVPCSDPDLGLSQKEPILWGMIERKLSLNDGAHVSDSHGLRFLLRLVGCALLTHYSCAPCFLR
jgi:hypothetical protein